MGVTNMVEKDIIETKISEGKEKAEEKIDEHKEKAEEKINQKKGTGKKYGWKNDRRFIQRL